MDVNEFFYARTHEDVIKIAQKHGGEVSDMQSLPSREELMKRAQYSMDMSILNDGVKFPKSFYKNVTHDYSCMVSIGTQVLHLQGISSSAKNETIRVTSINEISE